LPNADLKPDDKWLKYFDLRPSPVLTKDLVAVNTYGSFSRGIATGANEFFAISASKAAQHNLPRSLFLRSVTKSAQIKKPVFTDDDFDLLEKSDAPVLLLNLNGCISGPARDYIEYGVRQGFHLRYLTKARNPWYKLERRVPAPLLFGVFSRDGFNVVRNKSSALNLTCYHGFNPNLFGRDHVDELFLYFQSRAARRLLELNMRRYGEGLDKFEPNDLNRALAPSPGWFSRLPPRLIQQGMEECENGEVLPEEIEQCFDTLMGSAGGSVSPEDDSVAILR
jgi:adenine-specific DNA-methyltransferase